MRRSIQLRGEKDLERQLSLAVKAGFTEIAMSFASDDMLFRDDFEASTDRMRALLDRYGLTCTQTHLPFYHLLVPAEQTDEATETALRRGLWATAQLGAFWTAFHPRSAVNDGYDRDKGFDANLAELQALLPFAERYNVGIAVENMPLYPYTQADWRFFGGGYEELCALCDALQSDRVGICWDFGHAHTAALDQSCALRAVGKRLQITHVHDNYRNGDHHLLPLLGSREWHCINWEKAMRTLGETGYTGALTLEVIDPPVALTESYLRLGFDTLGCLDALARGESLTD